MPREYRCNADDDCPNSTPAPGPCDDCRDANYAARPRRKPARGNSGHFPQRPLNAPSDACPT